MSVIEFDQYWLAITKIEAQEMLIGITIADYPQLKPQRRKELYNKLRRHEGSAQEGNLMSPEEIAKAIGELSGR